MQAKVILDRIKAEHFFLVFSKHGNHLVLAVKDLDFHGVCREARDCFQAFLAVSSPVTPSRAFNLRIVIDFSKRRSPPAFSLVICWACKRHYKRQNKPASKSTFSKNQKIRFLDVSREFPRFPPNCLDLRLNLYLELCYTSQLISTLFESILIY